TPSPSTRRYSSPTCTANSGRRSTTSTRNVTGQPRVTSALSTRSRLSARSRPLSRSILAKGVPVSTSTAATTSSGLMRSTPVTATSRTTSSREPSRIQVTTQTRETTSNVTKAIFHGSDRDRSVARPSSAFTGGPPGLPRCSALYAAARRVGPGPLGQGRHDLRTQLGHVPRPHGQDDVPGPGQLDHGAHGLLPARYVPHTVVSDLGGDEFTGDPGFGVL